MPSGQWVWRPVCQCLTLFRRQDGPSFMPHGLGHSHRKGKKLIQTLKDIQDMCIHLVCPNTLICIFASSLHDVYALLYIYIIFTMQYLHIIISSSHLQSLSPELVYVKGVDIFLAAFRPQALHSLAVLILTARLGSCFVTR